MGAYAQVGGSVYALNGDVTATAIEHGLMLKSVGDEPYYESVTGFPDTLLVQLHAWSGNDTECLASPLLGTIPNCVWVCPNFGGLNNQPEGANHPAQMERIKRVIDTTVATYGMKRIILVGVSGGAATAYYMLGYYPGLVQGVSAWVGYHDLAAWYAENAGHRSEIEACLGGTPSALPAEYLARSPKGVLSNARNAIVWVNSGNSDTEILPHHSLDAYAQLAGLTGIDRHLNQFSGGHVIDYPTAVIQINAMIAAT